MKKVILLVAALMMIAGSAYGASWTGYVAQQTRTDLAGGVNIQGPYHFNITINGTAVQLGSPLGQQAYTYPLTGTIDTAGNITMDAGQTVPVTTAYGVLSAAVLSATFDQSAAGTFTTGVTEYPTNGLTYNFTVPIPAAFWLLLSGVAGIIGLRRRNK